jgi:hypothetical protein
MKMVKSLLLGGAAGLVAVASAQAADLPVKAKAVEYVKICSLYGEGFFYIPGTDTCLKIGGWVRADFYANQTSSNAPPLNVNTRSTTPDFSDRSRTVVSFDARSQTEWGTLRAYYRGGFEFTAGLTSQYGDGSYYYERAFIQLGGWTFGRSQSFFDIFASQWSYGAAYFGGGSNTGAFGINLAAYTASFGNGVSATLAIEEGNVRRNALWDATAYTGVNTQPGNTAIVSPAGNPLAATGGTTSIGPMGPATNGFTTCGVALVGNDSLIATTGAPNTISTAALNAVGCGWGDYAAQSVPDIVGNLRVDQAWGSAQISGALHQVRGNYYGDNFIVASTGFTGIAPSDAWGYAFNAGIMFNLPWNPGDKFWIEGTYAVGSPSYAGWGRNTGLFDGVARFDGNRLAAGAALDGVFACVGGVLGGNLPAGSAGCIQSGIQLSTTWAISAAIEHYWTPALRTSVFGAYSFWTAGNAGNAIMCASPLSPIRTASAVATPGLGINVGPTGAIGLQGCNFDYASWGAGTRTIWNPVRNLDVGFEVMYQQINTEMDPNRVLWNFGGAGTRPSGLYVPADLGTWVGMVRLQRNFYP